MWNHDDDKNTDDGHLELYWNDKNNISVRYFEIKNVFIEIFYDFETV